jgi:hypothetical protein
MHNVSVRENSALLEFIDDADLQAVVFERRAWL